MSLDFSYLEKKLEQEINNIYLSFSKDEDINSFSLYTDSGGMTLCIAINTNEYLQKNLNEEPDEVCYYTWVPDEWKYNYVESNVLDELSSMLSSYILSNRNKDFDNYLKKLIQVCINSLNAMKKKNHNKLEKTVLLFTISDYDSPLEKLEWIQKLNNNYIVKEYEKCMDEL